MPSEVKFTEVNNGTSELGALTWISDWHKVRGPIAVSVLSDWHKVRSKFTSSSSLYIIFHLFEHTSISCLAPLCST